MADEGVEPYHLKGFRSATEEVNYYLSAAVFVPLPAESVLFEMMFDDRALRNADELWATMMEELHYLMGLDDYVWHRVSFTFDETGESGGFLREESLHGAFVAAGYLFNDRFRQLQHYPLVLTQGDINARLDQLLREPLEVLDQQSRDVRFLLEVDVPRPRIVSNLKFAREIPCSTLVVEQIHGIGARVLKDHELYEEPMLRSRDLVCQAERFVGPSIKERQRQSIVDRIDRLNKPSKQIQGFNVYYQLATARLRLDPRLRDFTGITRTTTMLKLAHAEYDQLTTRQRAAYEHPKRQLSTQVNQSKQDQIAYLRERLTAFDTRVAEDARDVGKNKSTEHGRFDEEDLQRMAEMLDELRADRDSTAEFVGAGLSGPLAPTLAQQKIFLAKAQGMLPQKGPLLDWVRYVCFHRASFKGVVLTTLEAGVCKKAFKFLFASQLPYYGVFLELSRKKYILPDPTSPDFLFEDIPPADYMEFTYADPIRFHTSEDMKLQTENVFVLENTEFEGDIVTSWMPPRTWDSFVEHLSLSRGGTGGRGGGRKRVQVPQDVRARLKAEMPYLNDEDFENGPQRPSLRPRVGEAPLKAHVAAEDDDGSDSGDDAADAVEVNLDHVPDELARLRLKYGDFDEKADSFAIRLLGGKWTKKYKDVIADFVAVVPVGATAKEYCGNFSWPQKVSFSIRKYTMDGAMAMAREVKRRANHFYGIFLRGDDENFIFSDDDLESYEEDLGWVTWLIVVEGATRIRAGRIRDELVPANWH